MCAPTIAIRSRTLHGLSREPARQPECSEAAALLRPTSWCCAWPASDDFEFAPSLSRAFGEKLLAALDEERRADRAVKDNCLLQLGVALGSAAGLDQLLRCSQAQPCLPRWAAGLGPHVDSADESHAKAGK